MSDPACALASLEANEPLAGTAVESIDRWVLLEVTEVWAPKVLDTEALPELARQRLREWNEAPRTRVQLIRRPGRSGKRPLLMRVERGQVAQVELERLEDLAELRLDALTPEPTEPIVLVCVHGRRDRCCAQHGSAVYRSLQSRIGEVWQTSHLGGHRFAACVLSLPDGLMYGRMRSEHADAFVAAVRAGEVDALDRFRGRCAYDRPTQAAEIFLRKRSEELGVDALEWLGTAADGDRAWTARLRTPTGEARESVGLDDVGVSSPASGGAEPEPRTRFIEL